ncbi:hypothetical protein VTK26DRAFT_6825 [Humicola hyalothermophila]
MSVPRPVRAKAGSTVCIRSVRRREGPISALGVPAAAPAPAPREEARTEKRDHHIGGFNAVVYITITWQATSLAWDLQIRAPRCPPGVTVLTTRPFCLAESRRRQWLVATLKSFIGPFHFSIVQQSDPARACLTDVGPTRSPSGRTLPIRGTAKSIVTRTRTDKIIQQIIQLLRSAWFDSTAVAQKLRAEM